MDPESRASAATWASSACSSETAHRMAWLRGFKSLRPPLRYGVLLAYSRNSTAPSIRLFPLSFCIRLYCRTLARIPGYSHNTATASAVSNGARAEPFHDIRFNSEILSQIRRSYSTPTLLRLHPIYIDLPSTHFHYPLSTFVLPSSFTRPTVHTMASRFVENLEEVPITHPHLNVSLEDILAEEKRKRSGSHSSESSTNPRSGSDSIPSPTSPTSESKMDAIRRRAFPLGSRKGRRVS